MTTTITYGHGFLDDFSSVAAWSEPAPDPDGTFALLNGDWIALYNTSGGEYAICNTANLGINPSTYTKILVRYFTFGGAKAKIVLEDSNTDLLPILAETENTTMGLVSATIDFGDAHNLDHVWLYANSAIGFVYYDFVLICKGIFTLPNDSYYLDFRPNPRIVDLGIPGRDTDVTQHFGSGNAASAERFSGASVSST